MGTLDKVRSTLRKPVKYTQAVLHWKRFNFGEAPPIFANSKPKSGSHLLLQIMQGVCQVAPYTYVESDPIRTVKATGGRNTADSILTTIKAIPTGAIGWGYVDPTPENVAYLCQPGRINYFTYRDPRDLLVSHVYYATSMHEGHGMNKLYNSLTDFNERLKIAITGIDRDGMYMVNISQRYDGVFEWLKQPHTLCLRFEDMIDDQDNTLRLILGEFDKAGYKLPISEDSALSSLREAIQPTKSHTFRKGRTGSWKDHFTEVHKDLFKQVAGDLVVRLGYEKDNNW